jgi:hypothetical protein
MLRRLKATLASSVFAWLCLYSLVPCEVRADDIVIASSSRYEVRPFSSLPYISWRARMLGAYIEASNPFEDQGEPAISCALPCITGSQSEADVTSPALTNPITNLVDVNEDSYGRWFRGSEIKFSLDGLIIPFPSTNFTRTTQFLRPTGFWFLAQDLQSGFEPVTVIAFGHGLSGFAERYHDFTTHPGLHPQTYLTAPSSVVASSVNHPPKRSMPLTRDYPRWTWGSGSRPVFEPRIPIQFWRRIDLGDKGIIPATRLPIRSGSSRPPTF